MLGGGLEEGERKMLECLLEARFGALAEWASEKLSRTARPDLEAIVSRVAAPGVAEGFGLVR